MTYELSSGRIGDGVEQVQLAVRPDDPVAVGIDPGEDRLVRLADRLIGAVMHGGGHVGGGQLVDAHYWPISGMRAAQHKRGGAVDAVLLNSVS